jgi:hypothetical protein
LQSFFDHFPVSEFFNSHACLQQLSDCCTIPRRAGAPVLRNDFLLAATIFFSLSPTCHGQTHNTVVATINFLHAVHDSNEGKKELPAIGAEVSQERQQKIKQTVQATQ